MVLFHLCSKKLTKFLLFLSNYLDAFRLHKKPQLKAQIDLVYKFALILSNVWPKGFLLHMLEQKKVLKSKCKKVNFNVHSQLVGVHCHLFCLFLCLSICVSVDGKHFYSARTHFFSIFFRPLVFSFSLSFSFRCAA